MKILVLGANGFVGRAVADALADHHQVFRGERVPEPGHDNSVRVDLAEKKSIEKVLQNIKPEVVINCAGIVENSEKAELNVAFTRNLLDAISKHRQGTKKIIILGSAGEYGEVDSLPVSEDAPRRALSQYALSKIKEVDLALSYRNKHKLPVIIARIFNPVGARMHPRLLIPQIAKQIREVGEGAKELIEVNRLDSRRDYLDIRDVASAIRLLVEKKTAHAVYNIGSGRSTSNKSLIGLMISGSRLGQLPKVIETSDTPELSVASQADITRIKKELGWVPVYKLEETVKEIVNLQEEKINILIVGAGKAGQLIYDDIANELSSPFHVVGFVDDDARKQQEKIEGVEVLGTTDELKNIIKANNVKELFITIPSERGKVVRQIIQETIGAKVVYKILPRLPEVLMQDFKKGYLKYIRRVKAEDLLGGEILKTDQQPITSYAQGKIIMITGAAGSIGSELSRQVAAHEAKRLILYDWWENGMFELRNQLLENYPEQMFEFIIGDINDANKLNQVMMAFKPDTIFHAAAYKHVPLMEHNPAEAVKNNIKGTKAVAETAIKNKVSKFVLVSSDKAVNPTNIMGATKRAAEKIIHVLAGEQDQTSFFAVRFGNVINSNGSAIPIFEKQIEQGGPVTVTHKNITRFFMTIPEAVHLILQSWVIGKNNDLFVLDMGEPIRIYDLAKLLIVLEGYEPETEIKINIIGLRPGEKLYEEVLVKEEETLSTPVNKVFRTKNYMNFDKEKFMQDLEVVISSLGSNSLNIKHMKQELREMVPTYRPSKLSEPSSKQPVI